VYLYDRQDKRVDFLMEGIVGALVGIYRGKIKKVRRLMSRAKKFDRRRILRRGYALLERDGKVIDHRDNFAAGDELTVIMHNKKIKVRVL
jgi:exonuclease VII large subunit